MLLLLLLLFVATVAVELVFCCWTALSGTSSTPVSGYCFCLCDMAVVVSSPFSVFGVIGYCDSNYKKRNNNAASNTT